MVSRWYLAAKEEATTGKVAVARRWTFIDRVVSSNAPGMLLGQPGPKDTEKERRGMQARDDALGAFGLAPTQH